MIAPNDEVVNQLQDIVNDLDAEIKNYTRALEKNESMLTEALQAKNVKEAAMFIGSKEIIKLALECTTKLRTRYNERLTLFRRVSQQELSSFIVEINEGPDQWENLIGP